MKPLCEAHRLLSWYPYTHTPIHPHKIPTHLYRIWLPANPDQGIHSIQPLTLTPFIQGNDDPNKIPCIPCVTIRCLVRLTVDWTSWNANNYCLPVYRIDCNVYDFIGILLWKVLITSCSQLSIYEFTHQVNNCQYAKQYCLLYQIVIITSILRSWYFLAFEINDRIHRWHTGADSSQFAQRLYYANRSLIEA